MAAHLTFPFSAVGTPEHAADLPKETDLVVLGGGVAGVCTALYAARRGLRVVLCEKGRIAAEQSGRNWGWIRAQGRDPAELPMMMEAHRLWPELVADAGEDIGLRTIGITYLAREEKDLARYEDWLEHARQHQLDSRMLSAAEVAEMIPGSTYAGGLHTPSDKKAEPWASVPALARLAAREGVVIREGCAVRAWETSGGAISSVVTEAGEIRCTALAICAGALSRLFLGRHGVRIPQLSVRASVAATQPLGGIHDGAASDGRTAFRPRGDGGYSIAPSAAHELFVGPDAFASLTYFIREFLSDPLNTGLRPLAPRGYPDGWATARAWAADAPTPFEAMRVLNPAPNRTRLEALRQRFSALFPNAGEVRLAAAWAGMIDVLPDVVPVIDALPVKGAFLATGLSGHGFGIGPAVGRVMADLVTGRDPGHDLTRFRFGRFADGTKLVPGPSL